MRNIVDVLVGVMQSPGEMLIRRWNWKAALASSLCRAALFFCVNIGAGVPAALGAMQAEFAYRAATAGFYGALTQAFRQVEPRWQGALAAVTLVSGVSHAVELGIHWWRGTPNLAASILASLCFTALSTSFNLHAMRQGVLITGAGGHGILTDLRLLPGVVAGLFAQVRSRP